MQTIVNHLPSIPAIRPKEDPLQCTNNVALQLSENKLRLFFINKLSSSCTALYTRFSLPWFIDSALICIQSFSGSQGAKVSSPSIQPESRKLTLSIFIKTATTQIFHNSQTKHSKLVILASFRISTSLHALSPSCQQKYKFLGRLHLTTTASCSI